jgi:DNA-binding transcriptional LysR family regulator
MHLLSLRYFIAITDYKSFTKAAEHLFVTQPTLSRQIADLEEEFGVHLFERTTRSVVLTEAGSLFLEEAREIVKSCDNLTEKMKSTKKHKTLSISIGYLGFLEYQMLTESLKSLSSKYPYIDFSLIRCSLAELNQSLMEGKFDVIFTVAVGLENLPGVTFTKVVKNKLQIVIPSDHYLADRSSVQMAELAKEHFVMFERSVSPLTVDNTLDLCLRKGFSPKVVYYAKDPQTVLFMVSSGRGVAFLSSRLAAQNTEGVKFLDIEDCDIDFDVVVAYKKDNPNMAIPLFVSEVKNKGQDFADSE